MPTSRRQFIENSFALGAFGSLLSPELLEAIARPQAAAPSGVDAPNNAFKFWSGFYDSVNPASPAYGMKFRGNPADKLEAPKVETQYLNFKTEEKKFRYATDINKEELLDHDGDVGVSMGISQFRPGTSDQKDQASQLRVDVVQTHEFMNFLAPLAWTAIASIKPDNAGKIPSLDELGFKSDKVMQSTSKILLTSGTGKLAVNVSRAPNDSKFLSVLKIMIAGAKLAAPMVSLPAISVPALSTFSEAFAYWEERTRFVMNGGLVNAIATQQALADPEREDTYIGLVSGDYVMVKKQDTEELAKELPNLELVQGYLVRKDADPNQPLQARAANAIPGITYATIRMAVKPMNSSLAGPAAGGGAGGGGAAGKGGAKKSGEKGDKGDKGEKNEKSSTEKPLR